MHTVFQLIDTMALTLMNTNAFSAELIIHVEKKNIKDIFQ